MRNYVIRRLILIPITVVIVTIIVFIFMRVIPGDAAQVRCGSAGVADETCIDVLRERLGLTICDDASNLAEDIKCTIEQYGKWFTDIILKWDFGFSISEEKPISEKLWPRLANTLQLGMLSIFFSLFLGIPVGVVSALRPGKLADYVARFFSILAISVPNFWIGTLVIFLPAYFWQVRVSPDWTGWAEPETHLRILALAAFILGLSSAGYIARIARSSMLEVLRGDYVRTARAKGLREAVIVGRHVFRPSMITVFTIAGIQLGLILGGSVIMEAIFTIPGMGAWIITGVQERDFQIVQAVTLLIAVWFMVVRFFTDIGYAYIDPRIRY